MLNLFRRFRPTKRIMIRALIYRGEESWTVQGLEFDIVARGSTPHDASESFLHLLRGWIELDTELGREPFSALVPAPRKYWEMFEQTPMIVTDQHDEHKTIQIPPSNIVSTPEFRLCEAA